MEETHIFAANDVITYELPLNDAVRIALRLENLFSQFQKTAAATSTLMSKNAIDAILKMIEVTDRPDLKSKLSQTLTQYANALSQLKASPKLDPAKLQKTLKNIESLTHYLHSQHARIGEPLRQNEFLSQIRSNLVNPGGVCDYRLPAYILWQNKSPAEKSKDLREWENFFAPLKDITTTILTLTRDSNPAEKVSAPNGFYAQPLNPLTPCHLLRVILPKHYNLFPEFSAGKHRVAIRFLTPSYFGGAKSTQTSETVSFELVCCKI